MRLGWWSELNKLERRTYLAAFGGLALDSMDTTIYALVTPTLIAVLGITKPEAGLLATVNLLGAALGGWVGGILADRFGRVRVLQLTILVVALSTFAAAFANGFVYLAVARAIQGIGYGAEAAVGAVLVGDRMDRDRMNRSATCRSSRGARSGIASPRPLVGGCGGAKRAMKSGIRARTAPTVEQGHGMQRTA